MAGWLTGTVEWRNKRGKPVRAHGEFMVLPPSHSTRIDVLFRSDEDMARGDWTIHCRRAWDIVPDPDQPDLGDL